MTLPSLKSGAAPILSVRNLTLEFRMAGRWLPAVDSVDFDLAPGETLGVVGESGSGKSLTALALMGFVGRMRRNQRVSGQALYAGRDLLGLPDRQMQALRGNDIAMIFQEPMTSLDPSFKVGAQIAAGVRLHQKVSRAEARRIAIDAMERVHIPNAAIRADSYPHEFSGGMRQRVLIAMAIANRPSVLIADEPTTALDVSVQAQVLRLLKDMQKDLGLSMIFITHNMGVVADICDRVAVMYAGQIVEKASVDDLFDSPRHPYTERLLSSMPSIEKRSGPLTWIPGTPPQFTDFPAGCRFRPRCAHATDACLGETRLTHGTGGRSNRCTLGQDWQNPKGETEASWT